MANSNGMITAPVRLVEDVKSVLNETASNDLGTLCKKNNINVWARYKPSTGGCVKNRKRENGNNEYYSVVYGIAKYDNGTLVGREDIFKIVNINNFSDVLTWNLKQPTLNYYRLQDFNGYNHNAKFSFDNSNYKFFPANTYGTQTGPFYNMEYPILTMASDRPSGMTFTPVQCWEEHTSETLSTYSVLYLEDLFYAASHEAINTFRISDFKLGIAVVKGNNSFVFNTGVSFGTIFSSGTTRTQDLNFTINDTTYHIGSIALQANGGYVLLIINFKTFNDILGVNYFVGDNVTVKVRVVMLETNDNIWVYNTIPSGINVYAFEPIDGFCYKNVTLKKIYTFVSVTSYTNRVSHAVRNAGKFFSSTLNEELGTQQVDYEYVNGNWSLISGKTARVINSGTGDYDDPSGEGSYMCRFLLDTDYKWRLSNNVFVQDNTSSGTYVRFRLRLRGFVCCEFRAKDNQALTNNYLFPEDIDVIKTPKLYLRVTSSSFGDVHIKIMNNNQYIIPSTGIEVGSFSPSSFIWNKTNVVQNSHLRYCDKQYGSNSDNVNKCHSHMGNLNVIGGTTTQSEIYIFVQKTALTKPDDFYMELFYTFGPDERGNYEEIKVSDQSGNTKITGDLYYWPSY